LPLSRLSGDEHKIPEQVCPPACETARWEALYYGELPIATSKEAIMIVKTKQGYQVKSEEGKNLSKPNLTKKEAEKRLREIEYFKHKNK
jgi:hypothetical protein